MQMNSSPLEHLGREDLMLLIRRGALKEATFLVFVNSNSVKLKSKLTKIMRRW